MPAIIHALDKDHLKELIKEHIKAYGIECSLNHIDVSQVKSMRSMFQNCPFDVYCESLGLNYPRTAALMYKMRTQPALALESSEWMTDLGAP